MYSSINKLKILQKIEDVKEIILKASPLESYTMKEVYIFGTKGLGDKAYNACISKGIKVKGYIDNNKAIQNTEHNGVKIFALEDVLPLQKQTYIIIATLTYWRGIEEQLKSYKVEQYIAYPYLSIWDTGNFPPADRALDGMVEDLINNREKYLGLYEVLEDELSKQVLDAILNFRLSFDTKYLVQAYNLSTAQGEEYFDNHIFQLKNNEVFVDGGGYQGETTQRFIEKVKGSYEKIYIFEPDPKLMNTIKETLGIYQKVKYIEAAVGEQNGLINFNVTGGLGGSVTSDGKEKVQVKALDRVIDGKVTFIKLDIEGSESVALKGAEKVIKSNEPKLVISAYHKAPDLWKLVQQIKDMGIKYKVYLRHYGKNCFATDLYFVK